MTSLRLAALAVLTLLVQACAADLAFSAGATIPSGEPSATRGVWAGEVRATLQPAGAVETGIWPVDHLTIGMELQGRAVHEAGARFTTGASLGLATGDGSYQVFAQFDSGIPLGWSQQVQGYYVGLTSGALWALVPRAPDSGPNRVFKLFDQRTYLGPMLRYRRVDMEQRALQLPSVVQHDIVLGLQMRVQFGTDLL